MGQTALQGPDPDDEPWFASLLGLPPGLRLSELVQYARAWLILRAALLPVLILLPVVVYWENLSVLKSAWYAPFMGIAACALPSAGVPVAGGIIFFPMLTHAGICPRDAVAFSAATQMLGVGVFAPLNWLVLEPSVLMPRVWFISALPASAGLIISLLLIPIKSNALLKGIYSIFCLCVAGYTARGLAHEQLDTSSTDGEKASHKSTSSLNSPSCSDLVIFGCASVLGGLLTGYIGNSIENVLFVLLTWRYGVNARKASVTSITLVGWLSMLSFVIHALSPCNPEAEGYIGAVPYMYWLMVLPGILIGSVCGPTISMTLGSRHIMKIFVALLCIEVLRHLVSNLGLLGGGASACLPQCASAIAKHHHDRAHPHVKPHAKLSHGGEGRLGGERGPRANDV